MGGDNFGHDLPGVQNLQKKHQHFENELDSHNSRIKVNATTDHVQLVSSQHVWEQDLPHTHIPCTPSPFTHTQAVVTRGEQLALADHFAKSAIKERCQQLQGLWKDLNTASAARYAGSYLSAY